MSITPEHPSTSATTRPHRVIHLGADEVAVARLAPEPIQHRPTAAHELGYITALAEAVERGVLPGRPPDGFGRALARAATDDPRSVIARIRNGLVTAHTEVSDVAVLRTRVSPFTVLPGEQPRGAAAGGRPGQVREPGAGQDAAASRLGLRVLHFDDLAHLHAWVADSLGRSLTRAIKRGRPQEIANTGVRRPVLASMVLLTFADGTAPQWAPMLSDGISRLAVCAASLLGVLDSEPHAAASAVADGLLNVGRGLTPSSPTYELARRMRRHHDSLVRQYRAHLTDEADAPGSSGAPDESGVKIRQFLTLPVDLHLLAIDPTDGEPRPMETALETLVSDVHLGVDGWSHDDEGRHTATRALKRLAANGDITSDLLQLCMGSRDVQQVPELRPSPIGYATSSDPMPTAHDAIRPAAIAEQDRLLLRRAVSLMTMLLGPHLYPTVKSALREVSGRPRLTMQQTVEYVAPLLYEPWGTQKPATKAWAYGGPVPSWIRDTQITPAHPADYLELVQIALDPNAASHSVTAAQLELALAGGTALIADGILTTALVGGSGGSTSSLAFRGTINATVEALTQTEEGLTALAVAANHFRPSQNIRSARLPAIDLDQPDRVARDGMGIAIRTTEVALAHIAAQGGAVAHEGQPTSDAVEPTPMQNLQARARHLPREARTMLHGVKLTKALHDETGGPTGLTENDLDAVHDALSQSLKLVGRLT